MGKILVLLLVVLVAYAFLRSIAAPKRKAQPGPRQRPGERMVPCGQCGVNLPESEALADGGRYFCCDEHLRQFGK